MSTPQYIEARLLPFAQTLGEWTASNPIPKQGEIVIETGTPCKMKIGDGATAYLSLPYVTGGAGTPETLQDVLNLGHTASEGGGNVGVIVLLDTTTLLTGNYSANGIYIAGLVSRMDYGVGTIKYSVPGFPGYTQIAFVDPTTTRTVVFRDLGGTVAYLSDITAAGNLQSVLNSGNTANTTSSGIADFTLTNSGDSNHVSTDLVEIISSTFKSRQKANEFRITKIAGTTIQALLSGGGSGGQLQLRNDPSGFNVVLSPTTLTASRTNTTPNRDGVLEIENRFDTPIDANYQISYPRLYIELPVITANRNLNMSLASGTPVAGDVVEIANLNNSGFTWNLTGILVKDCLGAILAGLANQTPYRFRYNGTIWRQIV